MNFITLLKFLFLGAIQGFTEPIPVSSSGHLIIFKHLLNDSVMNDLNFEIFVNFGSLIAILFIFKDDILNLVKDFFQYIATKEKKYEENFKYCWLIVIGSIPAGFAGLLLKDKIETMLTDVKIVGIALLITALFLFIIKDMRGKKGDHNINFKNAVVIGLYQVVALFPGISRSGATLVGGMQQGLKRDVAFKFSFMLYIPISLATMILGLKDFLTSNVDSVLWIYYLGGMIVSGIITYFSAKWFRNLVKEGKLIYFVYYCIIAGLAVLIFL